MTAMLTRKGRRIASRASAADSVCARSEPASALHASQTDAAAAATAAAAPKSALAALLTGQVLQDGEVVLLILKPSLWFIALTSLRFTAIVGILLIAAIIWDDRLPADNLLYIEVGLFVVAGRVMVSVLQWMSRLYILTDLRVIRLSGVFSVEIFNCPLRKVARARLLRTARERVVRVGTIEFIPQDESYAIGTWQMIARPKKIHEQVVSTINRAKQGGPMCHV